MFTLLSWALSAFCSGRAVGSGRPSTGAAAPPGPLVEELDGARLEDVPGREDPEIGGPCVADDGRASEQLLDRLRGVLADAYIAPRWSAM